MQSKKHVEDFKNIQVILNKRKSKLEESVIKQYFKERCLSSEEIQSILNDYFDFTNHHRYIKEIDTLKESLLISSNKIKLLELEKEFICLLWKNDIPFSMLSKYYKLNELKKEG